MVIWQPYSSSGIEALMALVCCPKRKRRHLPAFNIPGGWYGDTQSIKWVSCGGLFSASFLSSTNKQWSTAASYACLKSEETRKGIKSKTCSDHIETLRLFLDQLEFMDDINCTGLLGLRRLLATRCSHEACCHPAAYPATFYWALPISQDHMSPDLPSMGRSIALLLQCGMTADDIDLLERVMPLAGDINALNILKWFSPAHYLYLTARRNNLKIPNCVRFLHSHGLDLHALLDETHSKSLHYETFRGNTPTSLMMRYSTTFSLLRSILRDLNVDLDNFIQEELQRGPLVKAGWKQHTLQVLFKFEFVPFIMPVILCRICSGPEQVATRVLLASHTGEDKIEFAFRNKRFKDFPGKKRWNCKRHRYLHYHLLPLPCQPNHSSSAWPGRGRLCVSLLVLRLQWYLYRMTEGFLTNPHVSIASIFPFTTEYGTRVTLTMRAVRTIFPT